MSRKEKTDELLKKHLPVFRKLKVGDPFFTLKSAYFISGKKGRFIQLFESELAKEKDIYTEFVTKELVPDVEDRPLFKLTYNPFYKEEYEIENKVTEDGREYSVYIIPVSELRVVLPDAQEIAYSLYESGLYEVAPASPFPNFEDQFLKEKSVIDLTTMLVDDVVDEPITNLTIKDFAAIMLMKPVSNKAWLNDLVNKAKSKI
jgi:hypothetical protein